MSTDIPVIHNISCLFYMTQFCSENVSVQYVIEAYVFTVYQHLGDLAVL